MLRAMIWMLRAMIWMLKAVMWMLRAMMYGAPEARDVVGVPGVRGQHDHHVWMLWAHVWMIEAYTPEVRDVVGVPGVRGEHDHHAGHHEGHHFVLLTPGAYADVRADVRAKRVVRHAHVRDGRVPQADAKGVVDALQEACKRGVHVRGGG
eukprot:5878844-Pyramimonas_sp.AAC.1